MIKVGEYCDLEVGKEVDFGLYLNSDSGEILLPQKYVPEHVKVGDKIEVFIYRDSDDRLIATTLQPLGKLNDFVALKVSDVTTHGAFMNWGLEKDLFVPNREQHRPFLVGNTYVVRICLDHKTDRLIGVGKLNAFFKKEPEDININDEVELLIYDETEIGFLAVINQKYAGLLYKNEIFEPVSIGDIKIGFIKKVREDGKIDLTLNKKAALAIDDDRQMIMDKLRAEDGFLPYHDKTDPELIKSVFGMSKKAFKRALGALYKEKLINISSNGIQLTEE